VAEDHARSIVTRNGSPDVAAELTLNPYRGCEHGCVYCYARPGHEYLGLSAGLDFETRIFVKLGAAALLRCRLASPGWRPRTLLLSGVTDPYQPVERHLRVTRSVLEVLVACRHPVAVITKSAMVERDAELLGELAGHGAAAVVLSLTTLDPGLARSLEPRAAAPARRLRTIEALSSLGIPVGVSVAPLVPGLTEEEIPRLLAAAGDAGARWAGWALLRLPHGVAGLFEDWLDRRMPERKDRILGRLRALHGGRLYDATFGARMRGTGPWARLIADFFELSARRHGLALAPPGLSTDCFRPPPDGQLALPLPPPSHRSRAAPQVRRRRPRFGECMLRGSPSNA
jgi:DNA repair photolyase